MQYIETYTFWQQEAFSKHASSSTEAKEDFAKLTLAQMVRRANIQKQFFSSFINKTEEEWRLLSVVDQMIFLQRRPSIRSWT